MNRITASLSVAAAGLIAAGGLLVASGPAMAAGCTGASCQENGSVTVQATITETLSAQSFSYNGGNPVGAGSTVGPQNGLGAPGNACTSSAWLMNGTVAGADSLCPELSVFVQTGDGAGYVITSSATDLSSGARSIPASNMQVALLQPSAQGSGSAYSTAVKAETNNAGSPVTLATKGSASAAGPGDQWDQFDALNVPSSTGNGTFTTTMTDIAVAA